MGEPAGVGTEAILKIYAAMRRPDARRTCFFLIDEPFRLARLARAFGTDFQIATIGDPAEADKAFGAGLPVLPITDISTDDFQDVVPGKPTAATATAVTRSISQAVGLAMDGQAAGVVTLPIQKSVLQESGFAHPGHTEYLEALAREAGDKDASAVMMLAAGSFRTVPLSVHLPLRAVPVSLRREEIVTKAIVVSEGLRRDFGIARPRLAVSGLNPHAGEQGRMGEEEDTIIRPAIETLRETGIDAFGPFPADTMFHEEARRGYDAALCMYHDQALIPVKTLAFHEAVNVTLGLPFVRTSPDHGTGLDIAGKGVARPDSTFAAIRMAEAMAMARANRSR
jgi:4-hydroxythreonine-4-phosphate dehydrogenase